MWNLGQEKKREIVPQNKGKPTVYSPGEHERPANQVGANPNNPGEKEETLREEKPKATRKSRKAKEEAQTEVGPEEPQTEWKGKVNVYGFLRFSRKMIETLGWKASVETRKSLAKDQPVTMTVNKDGSLTVRLNSQDRASAL